MKNRLLSRFRRPKLAAAACIAAYLAWPYVALYRVGDAMRHGDVATLSAAIDWDSVREGIKEDIADQIVPRPIGATDGLPPFGAGFATAMAGTVIDRTVTPASLAERQTILRTAGRTPHESLQSAWFTGLTQFDASFQLSPKEPGQEPVRVHLDLVETGWIPKWQVTRVWIPMTVLQNLQSHAT